MRIYLRFTVKNCRLRSATENESFKVPYSKKEERGVPQRMSAHRCHRQPCVNHI